MLRKRSLCGVCLTVILAVLILAACNKPEEAPAVVMGDESSQGSAQIAEQPEELAQPQAVEEQPPAEPLPVDAAMFVEHTTIPTGTVLGRGQVFTKTWGILNAGTTSWSETYALVFHQGEQMAGPDEQPLFEYHSMPVEAVQPGDFFTVTVVLTTPVEEGAYQGYWLLRDPEGKVFGIGENADEPLLVDIIVKAGAGEEVNRIENVTLTATPSNYTGPCPVQIIFSGAIEVNGMGPFSYNYVYDVNTALPGWEYLIPPPQTFTYNSPGWHVIETDFVVNIPEDSDGWIRLDSIGPDGSSFSEIYYNVDCTE